MKLPAPSFQLPASGFQLGRRRELERAVLEGFNVLEAGSWKLEAENHA